MADRFEADAEVYEPLCFSCKHYLDDQLKCAAFPKGIPVGVLTGELDHRKPLKGDKGIRYEAK